MGLITPRGHLVNNPPKVIFSFRYSNRCLVALGPHWKINLAHHLNLFDEDESYSNLYQQRCLTDVENVSPASMWLSYLSIQFLSVCAFKFIFPTTSSINKATSYLLDSSQYCIPISVGNIAKHAVVKLLQRFQINHKGQPVHSSFSCNHGLSIIQFFFLISSF